MQIGHKYFGVFGKIKGDISVKIAENKSTIFYWISGFAFLFSIIALCGVFVNDRLIIRDESIVLVFIGILVTFIVVSNYMQTKNAEQKADGLNTELDKTKNIVLGLINELENSIKEREREFYDSINSNLNRELKSKTERIENAEKRLDNVYKYSNIHFVCIYIRTKQYHDAIMQLFTCINMAKENEFGAVDFPIMEVVGVLKKDKPKLPAKIMYLEYIKKTNFKSNSFDKLIEIIKNSPEQ